MVNSLVTIFNDSAGISHLNATATFKCDVSNVFISATIFWKQPQEKEFTLKVFQGTSNFCELESGFLGNIIQKVFGDEFEKHSNFKLECPFKKGYHYIANLGFDNIIFVPTFLIPLKTMHWKIDYAVKAKFNNSRRVVNIFASKMTGSIER